MAEKVPNNYSINDLISGIDNSNRLMLSKAITLIESKRPSDQKAATALIDAVLGKKPQSLRLGITGVPGVGKSTFIETFGLYAIEQGCKVAVLTVDPSSALSKGSILGDKTRMSKLSQSDQAFIRPSPSGSMTGGVANKTRETILLFEAAGYDVIIVETVGVGQSEVMVKDMVDFFLVLMLAGGGDELQGIKRGIMEMADGIAINKADGDNVKKAMLAKKSFESALHYFPAHPSGWKVPTETCSSLEGTGINTIWKQVHEFVDMTKSNGWFDQNRQKQNTHWLEELIQAKIKEAFYARSGTKEKVDALKSSIQAGEISVRNALNQMFPSS
ncbi:MAG: methylmalonyl Co-A mutase-associated GTPase MeaB [Cyclobacteriaceae bacterium]